MTEQREFYRKKVNVSGFLVQATGDVEFRVHDISVDGLQGYFAAMPSIGEDARVSVRLPTLDVERRAIVVRIDRDPAGGAYIGFRFLEALRTAPAFPFQTADVVDRDDDFGF